MIAYGVQSVQSNLAAILMSTTPLSSTVLGHFYTTNEKFNFIKTFGILIGFSGILYLFSDNLLIDENNFISALLILLGSTCYVIGGVLTLKISKKKNENVTGSILIWATIILIPLVQFYRTALEFNTKIRLNYFCYLFRSCFNRYFGYYDLEF